MMGKIDAQAITEDFVARNHPDIYFALIPLLQNLSSDLEAYLHCSAHDVQITNTRTRAHCYFISLDGNKRPRVADFARYIANKVADFAIPRSERKRALTEAINKNSFAPVMELNAKAQRLFTRLPKSGEGGEVVLSVLAEAFLRLPQLFSKMVLKTNTEMHVHGSDGIHVGVNQESGSLTLYWGESKLYADPAQAASECFASLAPYLLGSGGSGAAQERDLQLMRDGIDLDDPLLEAALKRYLDPNDKFFNELEYRGLCLIGFDLNAYPKEPNSKEMQILAEEVSNAFEQRKKHFQKRIIEETIQSFEIQVICLPLPCVQEFREAFRKELGFNG